MKNIILYLNSLGLALFSRKFYYELFVVHKSLGFGYLLFISVLISVPVSYKTKGAMVNFIGNNISDSAEEVHENVEYISSQLPLLQIIQGKIQNVKIMPSPSVVESKQGKPVFIFDISDKIDDYSAYDDVVIINSDKFVMLFAGITMAVSLSDILPDIQKYLTVKESYTEFDIKSLFADMEILFLSPTLVFLLISSFWFFLRYAFKALTFSFFVGALSNIFLKTRIFTFRTFVRISCFSLTIVFIFEFMSYFWGIAIFSRPEIVYFVAHLLYINYAVESYKKMSFKG